MSKVYQDHFPRTINQYVPKMEFAADVVGDVVIANLGAPAAPDTDGILDGVSATDSAQSYTSANWQSTFDGSSTSLTSTSGMLDAKFGRALTATASAGANHVVTVTGRDYLGQIMKENLTLNGTNAIAGKKAFKYVDQVDVAAGAASDTMDLGWGDVLGVPYAAEATLSATENGAATSPTFVAAVTTDPQTATTGDPRGSYDPASACDGAIVHEVRYIANTDNLHGVAHYSG